MTEHTQDPNAAEHRARVERWPFLRQREEELANIAKEYGDTSRQYTTAVMAELHEYRADCDIDAMRPDDVYRGGE